MGSDMDLETWTMDLFKEVGPHSNWIYTCVLEPDVHRNEYYTSLCYITEQL